MAKPIGILFAIAFSRDPPPAKYNPITDSNVAILFSKILTKRQTRNSEGRTRNHGLDITVMMELRHGKARRDSDSYELYLEHFANVRFGSKADIENSSHLIV